ncbi:AAA family ATPase [Tundrisphaera lichenicola]|uniref:AAA family ATPase n=1 Tax=Tundrisphaera lichenicola TaxID=2029860 RepID=UPI003EB95837
MSNVVFRNLAEIRSEAVRWLWEGRIPLGKVTLLEGEPGVGKSSMALELAARVSRGAPMPCDRQELGTAPANVVIFSGDDDLADTISPRLEAAHADLAHIWAIDGEIDRDDLARLKPSLLIIDPLPSYICLSCENSPVEVIRNLDHLARDTGTAILAIQSIGEDSGRHKDPEFYGTPRSILHLTPVGHGGRRLAVAKSNLRHVPNIHPLVYYFDDEEGEVRIVNWSDGR